MKYFDELNLNWLQIKELTLANMKSRYRKTFAGFIWVVLSPIIMYSVQSLVFKIFLKLEVANYSIFLLGGLLPWIFITMTMQMCTPLFVTSGEMLKSFKVSPLVILSAQVLDNFFNFLFAFFILLIPALVASDIKFAGLFFLPLAIIQLIIGGASIAWLLATLQVFFRDTQFLIPFSTNVLLFLTPIFYPPEYVPESYKWMIEINPIYAFIEPFRSCLYNYSAEHFFMALAKGLILGCALTVISYKYWQKKKNEFYLFI